MLQPLTNDVACADGTAHGVIMMNSNGMDVAIYEDTLQFRIIGGVVDMYFLAGPTPNAVNDQLTQIIGRPVMPPYWAMGLMQSKCVPSFLLTCLHLIWACAHANVCRNGMHL